MKLIIVSLLLTLTDIIVIIVDFEDASANSVNYIANMHALSMHCQSNKL